MFLFPLGLEARTRRFPFACAAILLATVSYSILRFTPIERSQTTLLISPQSQELTRARLALTIAGCATTELEPEDCDFLKSTFDLTRPLPPATLARRLQSALQKKFDTDAAETKLERLADYLFNDDHWLEKAEELTSYPEHAVFVSAHAAFETEQLASQRGIHLLSRGNLNARSILEAQTTHGGWMHLIGNMIFFLILGIPVEERLGAFRFTLCYVIGGTLGLVAQILANTSETQGLLGASANVSAIAGCFLVFFWSSRMRVWVSLWFVWNRVSNVPSWIFIPLFIVMSDVTGTIEGGSNVAHLAHLGGFAAGAALASVITLLSPLPRGYVFPFELELMTEARSLQGEKALVPLAYLLFHHPDNIEAQDLALARIRDLGPRAWDGTRLAERFLARHFAEIFNHKLAEGGDLFCDFFVAIPEDWPLAQITNGYDLEKLSTAAARLEDRNPLASARLYALLLTRAKSLEIQQRLGQRIRTLQQRASHVSAS